MRSTFRPEVVGDVGGFGGLFARRLEALPRSAARLVDRRRRHEVARSPGSPNRRDTIGIDCVAMSVDDIAAQGAEPLFFLDYISIGKLVPDEIDEIVAGVADGCRQARCALLGGEMSEHPGRDGAGRVRPRRLRGRRRRTGARAAARRPRRRPDHRHREPGPALQRLLARPRRAARPRRHAISTRRRGRARTTRSPTSCSAERDLRARDAEARRRGAGARVRARHRRRHPRQPRARAARPLRRASCTRGAWDEPRIFAEIQQAGDVPDDEMEHVFNLGLGMLAVVPGRRRAARGRRRARRRATTPGSSARSSTATAASASTAERTALVASRATAASARAPTSTRRTRGSVMRRLNGRFGSGGSHTENGRFASAKSTYETRVDSPHVAALDHERARPAHVVGEQRRLAERIARGSLGSLADVAQVAAHARRRSGGRAARSACSAAAIAR